MILIAAALQPEAQPLIRRFNLKKDASFSPFDVFKNSSLVVIVAGIGRIRMASAVSAFLGKARGEIEYALNLGIAAAPPPIPVGSLFLINKLTDGSSGRVFFPDLLVKSPVPEKTLMTFDRPMSSQYEDSALVDMEGAGFFESAGLFLRSHKIGALKVVSDHFNPSSLSAGLIQRLIEERLPEIENYLEAIRFASDAFREPGLDTESDKLIKQISENLRLTSAQTTRLSKAALKACLRGTHLGMLHKFLGLRSESKEDAKRILSQIEAELV